MSIDNTKKWNVFFDIKGPAGVIKDAPNNGNPVDCVNMASLLSKLASNLPIKSFGIELEVIGIRIEQVEE